MVERYLAKVKTGFRLPLPAPKRKGRRVLVRSILGGENFFNHMEANTKNRLIVCLIFTALFFVGAYFLVNYYFEKKIQFRSFEECLSVVSDPSSNWITRKGAVDYCNEQTR